MTVSELMNLLEKLPPSSAVLVDGYEGGLDIPTVKFSVIVKQDRNPEDWDGAFMRCGPTAHGAFAAVVISRSE